MRLIAKLNQIYEDMPEIDNNLNLKLKWFVFGSLFTNGISLIINLIIK